MFDLWLKKLSAFSELKKSGKKIAGRFYLFVFLPSKEHAQFGVIASKRVGNAVKRNYEKRLIRAFIRENLNNFPSVGCLVICLAAREGDFLDKQKDFKRMVSRIEKMTGADESSK